MDDWRDSTGTDMRDALAHALRLSVPALTLTLAASAARTAGATGTEYGPYNWWKRAVAVLDITESHAVAGDVLNVYVDVSLDGVTWYNAIHFTQQAGDGTAKKEIAVLDHANPGTAVIVTTSDAASGVVRPAAWGGYVRGRWAVTDGGAHNQSHTFSLKIELQG